jgi:hypothetical protein
MPSSLLADVAAYVFDATASVFIADLAIIATAAALYVIPVYMIIRTINKCWIKVKT